MVVTLGRESNFVLGLKIGKVHEIMIFENRAF